jgi:hypothetical protein
MEAIFGDYDREAVGVPIEFTLQVKGWRELAMELPVNQPHSMRMKQFILQMLSEKVDRDITTRQV